METSLHRELKERYAAEEGRTEVVVDRYRIDAVVGEELIEIQHGPLAAIRDKVGRLLDGHHVRVVKPIIARKLLVKRPAIHPLSVLVCTFGLGALGLLPLYLWEMSVKGTFALTPGVAGSIAYVALFPSIVAYFCWNRGVAVIGANRTGLFINLIPVFAAILAIVFLGETLKAFHLVGMVLIVAGFVLFNR